MSKFLKSPYLHIAISPYLILFYSNHFNLSGWTEGNVLSPLNDTFKALADPNRRKIIQLLKEKDMSAGEIAELFRISKPSISHHLNILKQADLITDMRQGQSIVYSLNISVFEDMMNMLINFFDSSNQKG